MQLPIQLQFSSVSSLRYTLQVGVSVIAITDTQLYRLEIFSKTGTELFGGANSRSFDCFPRQTASGSSSGVFEYLRLSGPKDWYSRLLLFIYLFFIYIRFRTGIVFLTVFSTVSLKNMYVSLPCAPLPPYTIYSFVGDVSICIMHLFVNSSAVRWLH